MPPSPFHAPLLSVGKPGSTSAAAHQLRGLFPRTPSPDWDGQLFLRDLPKDVPFATSPKRPKADTLPARPSLREGRGLVFLTDGSALIVAQAGDRWRVLPAPISLCRDISLAGTRFCRGNVRVPPNRLVIRSLGPLSFAPTAESDAGMAALYDAALFAQIDALLAEPRHTTPLGDPRLLDPWATSIPQGRAYPSWTPWDAVFTREDTAIQALLARITRALLAHITPKLDVPPQDLSVDLRMCPAGGRLDLGQMTVRITPHMPPQTSRADNMTARALLQTYRPAIKAWCCGPEFPIPPAHRHPTKEQHFGPARPKIPYTPTAHERMQDTALLARILHAHPLG